MMPHPSRAGRTVRVFALLVLFATAPAPAAVDGSYTVLRSLPHDSARYTQGLEFRGDRLLESGGGRGRSALVEWDPETGRVHREHRLEAALFAEGLTRVGEKLILLTWTSGRALLFDEALEPAGEFRYRGQGWGLCHDGQSLWMSDGSHRLTRRDPNSFEVLGRVAVHDDNGPVDRLNELECVRGQVYANRFQRDEILRIDPARGTVTGRWDMATLKLRFRKPPGWKPHDQVLNGIAHHAGRDSFYVTGKNWPLLFEVRLLEPATEAAHDPAQ